MSTVVDWKSMLNDYTQRYPLPRPAYECEEEPGAYPTRRFYANATVKLSVGKGFGPTKQAAEQEAAKLCLVDLNEKRLEYNIKNSGGTSYPSWNPAALYDNISDLVHAGVTTNSLVNEVISWFDRIQAVVEKTNARRETKVTQRVCVEDNPPTAQAARPPQDVVAQLSYAQGHRPVSSWKGSDMEQPTYGPHPRIQSVAGKVIRRLMDEEKPNWTQSQLLLDEAFSIDRANALRQLRHKMEKSFNLQSMDGLMEWD
jgi:hypothetical protein